MQKPATTAAGRKLQDTIVYPDIFTFGATLEVPQCSHIGQPECYDDEKRILARKAETDRAEAEIRAAQAAAQSGNNRRHLDSTPENNYYPLQYYGSAQDFVGTCYALTGDEAQNVANGWVKLPQQDDVSTPLTLPWAFNFYGSTYPAGTTIYLNTNGNISLERPFAGYNPYIFPMDETLIAPFWADIDTRAQTAGAMAHGDIWYRFSNTENTLSVIWDRVGYYAQKGNRRNTFQVILSDATFEALGRNPITQGTNNICFCYGDMEWTTGVASWGRDGLGGFFGTPAIVGVNSGRDSPNDDYGPSEMFGQFSFGNSMVYDGVGPQPDGIDFLDNRGTTFQRIDFEPLCFDTSGNLPPVCTGFPQGGTVTAVCGEKLTLTLTFAAPEVDQRLNVFWTGSLPPGAMLTETRDDHVMVCVIMYTPQPGQQGTYFVTFTVTDDGTPPASISKTLTIVVPECDDREFCIPIPPVPGCDALDPRPFCTPYRTPEFCPADESFPELIRVRNDIAVNDPFVIESQDFWFHYLSDKAAQYAFTATQGYNAPRVHCCVDSIDDLLSVCFSGSSAPTSFVVRASGHHSGTGIFVLPTGFTGVELLSGIVKTPASVIAELSSLVPTPDKILVEEYIPGNGGVGLPNEFKFHMFGDKIGAITAIYHRGTDCACFAEFDESFERLDQKGCFTSAGPEKEDGACYAHEFPSGSVNAAPIKNMDVCTTPLPPIPTCIWNDMRAAARALGSTIGVYMRIDFFVAGTGAVYVQEYTANHNGGLHHCTARDENGCINSCFLGECWKDNGEKQYGSQVFGGPRTPEPSILDGWSARAATSQCDVAINQSPPNPPVTSCY